MNKRGKVLGIIPTEIIELIAAIVGVLLLIFVIVKFLGIFSSSPDRQNIQNFATLTGVIDDMLIKENAENILPYYIEKSSLLVVFDDSLSNSGNFIRPTNCKDKGCLAICKNSCVKFNGQCLKEELCKAYDNLNFKTSSLNYVVVEDGETVELYINKRGNDITIQIADDEIKERFRTG